MKTPLGLERIAASRALELVGGRAEARPMGFMGLVLLDGLEDPDRAAEVLLKSLPEAEYVLRVLGTCEADLEAVARLASELARGRIRKDETFAVRTTRRGKHDFTSIDMNVRVGSAVQEATGADVNLTEPDKIVWVEVVGPRVGIAITPGDVVWRKQRPGKPQALRLLKRISFAQMPYLGEGARPMGVRIGRAAQAFELGELVVAPHGPVDVGQLSAFISGLLEGRESRFRIQKRTYARRVDKVPIRLQDLYQLLRDRAGEPIIATDPTGRTPSEAADEVAEAFRGRGRVNILAGAREGLPKGALRFATVVLDLCPGLTFATEHTIPAVVGALVAVLEEAGLLAQGG
ncbi:RNA-binding protein [Candidatus Bathyarchaeota archaeon]|nr:MAG: RNA-binding protein [Candidatus Bathyarchaeota archaeon]